MFLLEFWYVAALADDLRAKPLARIICGVPVVLYRTETGKPVALHDLCSHRRAPLSLGRTSGDNIECAYHGLVFNPSGKCILIPSQDMIPSRANIRSFPVQDRHGLLWIWMGDAASADPEKIPILPWRNSPDWNADTVYYYHVNASHLLMTDNLLDLGHVAFIHADTIGFDASKLKRDPLVTEVQDDKVLNTRIIPSVEPSPAVRRWGNFKGLIKRTSISTWSPPCFTSILFRNEDESTVLEMRIDHLITPETDMTHHYWVSVSRNFRIEDAELTEQMRIDNDKVHEQDLAIVEAQQRMISLSPYYRDMPIKQDHGLMAAHRIMERLQATPPTHNHT
jgi:phenylpropionate dioxygenase-like ring-hydroxylating dioxygenase large terminal subunit